MSTVPPLTEFVGDVITTPGSTDFAMIVPVIGARTSVSSIEMRAFSTVTLSGRYANIRRFLYAVETATEFIVVERVGVVDAATGQQSNNGSLDVTLLVATYYVSPAGQ